MTTDNPDTDPDIQRLPAKAATRVARYGLVLLMALGGLMLWFGDPVIWLWIGSQVTSSQQAGFGPYMLVGSGILASTVVVVWLIGKANRAYQELSGAQQTVRVRLPWMRSMRDEREELRKEITVLDAVMVGTGLVGLMAFVAWFVFLAGSPLPS